MENHKNISFVAVSGFFSSGSSAAVDLIREYKDTYECKAEIRLIKDPYGISQLENALVDNWELLNSAAAIRDYLWLCKICNRNNSSPFSPVGLSYSKKITPDFMKISEKYIDKITDYKYTSDFFYQKFKKGYFSYVTDRIRMGVEFYSNGKLRTANRNVEKSRFSHPTREEFHTATREYLEELFGTCIPNGEPGKIILDQAISTNDVTPIHKYFNDAKMIIVDRDPRDMYVEDLVRWRENLDKDVSSRDAGERYIKRHKALREKIPENDDKILRITFEDLVLKYDETVPEIEKFLSFSPEEHIKPKEYLIPEKSCKNVGLWKQYYKEFAGALDAISEKLPEFCFDK